jgi:hypothetical protein
VDNNHLRHDYHVSRTCQIDTDHDVAQRLQEAENQLAIEREERSKDQKKIKELSIMATVVNTISRHGNPTEVPNDKINNVRMLWWWAVFANCP